MTPTFMRVSFAITSIQHTSARIIFFSVTLNPMFRSPLFRNGTEHIDAICTGNGPYLRILCEIRRNVAKIMFIYDLLNGSINSLKLPYMFAFNVTNHCLKSFFHIPFHKHNYSFASFFPRALSSHLYC